MVSGFFGRSVRRVFGDLYGDVNCSAIFGDLLGGGMVGDFFGNLFGDLIGGVGGAGR